MSVKVTSRGLAVGKKNVPLMLGAIHYWRLDRRLWSELLDKVAGMGFSMIETYIPWSVHELARGSFDFGQRDPKRDIEAFLSMCEDKGMSVMVRPGPHQNSEMTYFGYPERVLADRECQAVSAQGTPVILPAPPRAFPVPSYASEKFYTEVGLWFDAVCPIIEKHLHPNGCVVAIQADNECCFFFRTSAYDLDYSDGARKLYHGFLEKKYGDITALNEVYGTGYSRFDQADMPRKFEAGDRDDLPRYIDWAEYKEHYLVNALSRIRDMFAERGIKNIPVTHNYPGPIMGSPFNIPATEREIDIQGFDMYPTRRDYRLLKRGCQAANAQSRLPFIPEFGSGCWLWNPPLGFKDHRFTGPVALMHGIKAISHYMLVERERWYGSPIARDGRIRQPNYDYYKKLNEIIKKTKLPDLEYRPSILVSKSRTYQRLENSATILEPLTTLFLRLVGVGPDAECSEARFGFREPIQVAAEMLFKAWCEAIESCKYNFDIGDTDMSVDDMGRYALQVVPTYEMMAASEQEKLVEYAKGGGNLVIGPQIPEIDDRLRPCEVLRKALKGEPRDLEGYRGAKVYKTGKGTITVTPGLPDSEVMLTVGVEAAALLAGITRRFLTANAEIELAFHRNPDGDDGLLFVANPTKTQVRADILFDGSHKFTDLWSGETYDGAGMLEIDVPGYTVIMLEVK